MLSKWGFVGQTMQKATADGLVAGWSSCKLSCNTRDLSKLSRTKSFDAFVEGKLYKRMTHFLCRKVSLSSTAEEQLLFCLERYAVICEASQNAAKHFSQWHWAWLTLGGILDTVIDHLLLGNTKLHIHIYFPCRELQQNFFALFSITMVVYSWSVFRKPNLHSCWPQWVRRQYAADQRVWCRKVATRLILSAWKSSTSQYGLLHSSWEAALHQCYCCLGVRLGFWRRWVHLHIW